MKFPRTHLHSRVGRGVALVITLILLAVITFMAVTFLVLSNAEKAAAGTAKDQTISRNAVESARERFVADLMSRIFVAGNANNIGLFVSTNYYNWAGFNPGVVDPRNVNFDYDNTLAGPLSVADQRRNLLNLQFDPRVPVYVSNRITGTEEFRFYYDVNRNGRFDTNGLQLVRGVTGGYLHPNGAEDNNPFNGITNSFTGDPQWIGILERPEFPHSPTNRFIARYCYFAVPIGNSLDVNYIHNQARDPNKSAFNAFGTDYLRNQGVGPWEINLAAFLADLNSNMWGRSGFYVYDPFFGTVSGDAFADAMAIYRYRVTNSPSSLSSVQNLYYAAGSTEFAKDFRDGYTATPLLVNYAGLTTDSDNTRVGRPWPGSENPRHIFSHQDFFDFNKVGAVQVKLSQLATSNATYDSTTFMRMQEQLGTDSAPDVGKLNLNYVNLGGLRETNFISWTDPELLAGNAGKRIPAFGVSGSLLFFTNAADRVLKEQFGYSVTHIPVFTNGVLAYTPAVHRCLQVAANLAEVSAPNPTVNTPFPAPNVFRPIIIRSNTADVYIVGYTEVSTISGGADPQLVAPLSLMNSNDVSRIPTSVSANLVNVYGIPWVIGARKGLPNFNEFALQSTFSITRKLQMSKPSLGAVGSRSGWKTNLMYVVGISNSVAMEAWNSYLTNLGRAVNIYVDNDLAIEFRDKAGLKIYKQYTFTPPPINFAAGQWKGWVDSESEGKSFVIPIQTNITFLPDSVYRFGASPTFNNNLNIGFQDPSTWPNSQWPLPDWNLYVTNRLRFIIRDEASGRILDYVHLDNLSGNRQITQEFADADRALGFNGLWSTNRVNSGAPQGIINQLEVSLGNAGGSSTDWRGYGLGQPTGDTKKKEIDLFRVFNGLSPLYYPNMTDTNLTMQVPFTPTRHVFQYVTWQANDPLVHYLPGDMNTFTNETRKVEANEIIPSLSKLNIGHLNDRFEPWGGPKPKTGGLGGSGYPNAFKTALKDPNIRKPDNWDFPTNKFPNVGWIGRVHRGTPWQTIYLKADDVEDRVWSQWSGNYLEADSKTSKPKNDRLLFNSFTATFDENVTRGLLPVNQTNLAAWSAVFSGVIALTNNNLSGGVVPKVIEPVAVAGPNGPLARIHAGISAERTRTNQNGSFVHSGGNFENLGDVLSVREFTDASPFVDTKSAAFNTGMRDAVYEWLPQQVMGLLKFTEPRFVVYAYGQSLKPAPGAIITSRSLVGPDFFGLCTNYQVTAEIATRSIVRVVDPKSSTPRIVLENYNILPPD